MLSKYPNFRSTAKQALQSPFLTSKTYLACEKEMLISTASTILLSASNTSKEHE
jgi:hypothetical protein